MLTITCELKFKDGTKVTGRIQANSPDAEYPVMWSGAWLELRPAAPHRSDVGFLEFLFKGWAAQLGATVSVLKEGEYDRFAE